jgi:16S rRNA (adenine1518-N6/adenine1519-N6)-dimethyltransferase
MTSARWARPARKRFGQHFLEPVWVRKVVQAIGPAPDETFVEIGPGRGALTFPLVAAGARVVAFEIDRDLASELQSVAPPKLRVVQADFLDVTADRIREALAERPGVSVVRIAGNLPYNVASPVLLKLAELYRSGVPIEDATVMLQRGVADRLLASPGSRDYGVLTVLVRRQADVERLLQLPAGAFRPRPKVQSTLVRLRFHPSSPAVQDAEVFTALTQAIFTRRRKTLANALRAFPPSTELSPAAALARASIDPRRRPETLDLTELARLADVYAPAEASKGA